MLGAFSEAEICGSRHHRTDSPLLEQDLEERCWLSLVPEGRMTQRTFKHSRAGAPAEGLGAAPKMLALSASVNNGRLHHDCGGTPL